MQVRLTESDLYDAVVNHGAELKISLDLGDELKANYAKFGRR